MGNALSQCFFIPTPTLTEKNLPDQSGKVHIVTGGYAGCGFELVKILFQHNAKVYVAGRSADKANKAIADIKSAFPNSNGELIFLYVDLSDFKTIKPGAEEFMRQESRLDVLTNNAGVMTPPKGTKDAQGNEIHIGTNCLGPFLFTELLLPVLRSTAKSAAAGSVRVTWASSLAQQATAPSAGVEFDAKDGSLKQQWHDPVTAYGQSKAGNNFLASEFARRYGRDGGIISVCWNPGNLFSELQRHMPAYQKWILSTFLLFPGVYGGYTELYAGWSPEITEAQNGAYIAPWGRVYPAAKGVELGFKSKEQGGSGVAERFWDWCDAQTKQFR